MILSARTYAEKATSAIPKPGKRLANIARLENTGCLRHMSRFAHGSNNDGYLDMDAVNVVSIRKVSHFCILPCFIRTTWIQYGQEVGTAGHGLRGGTGITEILCLCLCRAGAKSPSHTRTTLYHTVRLLFSNHHLTPSHIISFFSPNDCLGQRALNVVGRRG